MLYITLRQYEYITAVAETGSLTGAAAALHVSQPSISVAISRAEQVAGERIFARGKGAAIALTPFGHRFVKDAGALLDLAQQIETSGQTERPFVLGCFEDVAPWYLAPTLKQLQIRHPETTFEGHAARFSALARDVAEGRVDLAITYDVGLGPTYETQRLHAVSPVAFLACDHPLADRPALDLRDLALHPLLLFNEDLSAGYMQALFDRLNLRPEIIRRAASLEMMRSMAAHGNGIGISYSHPPGDTSYDGQPLRTIPISTPEAIADIVLIWSALRAPDPQFTQIRTDIAAAIHPYPEASGG